MKTKSAAILCLAIIGIFSIFYIPKANYYAWRAVSIIEFKVFRIISPLFKNTESDSIKSMSYLASHRGAFSKTVAENSEKSILLAAQKGFQYIELDVTFTGDHIPIIFHDLNLKRKTNGSRLTSEVSFKEIKKDLDLGMTMIKKGKIKLFPSFTRMIEMNRMFSRVKKLERKQI